MKRMMLLLIVCNFTSLLFSQNKDSLEWAEMHRLDRMLDSVHKAGLVRESTFRVQMDEALQKTRQGIAESKQKEYEEANKEVLERQEKTQRKKRETMVLALAGFSAAILIMRMIVRWRRKIPRVPE